ncbi:hypothetical protein CDAR_610681 [Caerostris darwini]|uniref:Uncharacterized protein n=1 Tax=Caerostris darwini TaxID=1538125 RepID=A0AAV4MG07_9ARAC|nr:hypothetical protein CDAR_610681 [Caerostris darwini]
MAIYAILHMKPNSSFPPIRLTLLLNNIICFIDTTIAASLVSEASVLAFAKARELSHNPSQKFLSCIDREICLTVWRIVPIRSFPISMLGTILTYVLLFDNFNSKAHSYSFE